MTREQYIHQVRPRAREFVLTYLGMEGFQGNLDNIISHWVEYWDIELNICILYDKNNRPIMIL